MSGDQLHDADRDLVLDARLAPVASRAGVSVQP